MGLRDGKEELPALKNCAGTTGFKSLLVNLFNRLKGWIGGFTEMLPTEFGIHPIVHPPQPSWNRVSGFYGVLGNVLRKTMATVFTGKNVGQSIKEGTYVGVFGSR